MLQQFYLAGNPEEEFEEGEHYSYQGRRGQEEGRRRRQQSQCNNVFCGLDTRFLAEAFNIDENLARRLQGQADGEDNRGGIVQVRDKLRLVRPPKMQQREEEESGEKEWDEREREGRHRPGGRYNGIEESLCTLRLRENIGKPSRADIYSPEAGRVSSVNSHNLPVLRWLQLSAERGVLYSDALMLPHWHLNAHSILYAIRGRAQIQVVDHNGNCVFNGDVNEGQVLTIPQNYAVVKRAERGGFEWVSFKTNNKAMTSYLAGSTSAIKAMPVQVLASAFEVSEDEARRIKFGRQETTLSGTGRSSSQWRILDALKLVV